MIILSVIVAVTVTTRDARHALNERANLTVQSLAGGASEALWNLDEAAAHAVLSNLSRDPDYYSSLILDETGKPFVDHRLGGTDRPDLIVARAPLVREGGKLGNKQIGTIELVLTTTRAVAESQQRGWEIALAGGVMLVLVCGLLGWIIHGVTRPIIGMTEVMTELAKENVAVPVPSVPFDDEVGRMAASLRTLKSHAEERLQFIDRQSRHLEEIERAVNDSTRDLRETLETLRRTQDELLRSEKMAALGGMVAAIAHEINTPLGNSLTVATTLGEKTADFAKMLGGSELRRSALREFSEKFSAGNQLLVANLTRAAELIGSFKRVAVDQTSELRRAFDLAVTINEIVTMLRPTYKKTGHRIEIAAPPGIIMEGYPGALTQILTNLITNAVLHAFEGRDDGIIHISARIGDAADLKSDAPTPGQPLILICVDDNGAGIQPEILPRIFDPFFTTKLGSGGSGLGLHIVYATVCKVLGGRINVASGPGTGTTFSLALPLVAPDHGTGAG
ncbi:MAG: ATP-binding protein [Rhodospirillaceae bacterium]